ncbi:MAG: alternative ribosome rescue aminoacyl-tRNA hydrolase ArfB [Acidimicrobiales bacterium]
MAEPDERGPGRRDARGLRVSPGVVVPASELAWRFSASGGPGGQHVNTANTRAEVVWDVAGSPSLPPAMRARLVARLGPVVSVVASDRRSQARNRDLALARLHERVSEALDEQRARRPTRPTAASARRRLEAKRRRAALKRDRRGAGGETGE